MRRKIICALLFWFNVVLLQSQTVVELQNPNTSDNTATINNAFPTGTVIAETAVEVSLGAGVWKIDGTITVPIYCKLTLSAGAVLLRDNCTNTTPLIHLISRHASLEGTNFNLIQSQCDGLADGIVRIAQETANPTANVSFCSIRNLRIEGNINAKSNIVGLYLKNSMITAQVYFNSIEDIIIQHVNTGIRIEKSNANTVDNIALIAVGENGGTGIEILSAQENRMSNIHHSKSENANGIIFSTLDGESTVYNSFSNYFFEYDLSSTSGYCFGMSDTGLTNRNFLNIGCSNANAFLPLGATPTSYFSGSNFNVLTAQDRFYYFDFHMDLSKLTFKNGLELCK